ncbi:MAG: hypothetical protein GY771_09445 [bacterium]|nr:hypothetical protein [bacterium]
MVILKAGELSKVFKRIIEEFGGDVKEVEFDVDRRLADGKTREGSTCDVTGLSSICDLSAQVIQTYIQGPEERIFIMISMIGKASDTIDIFLSCESLEKKEKVFDILSQSLGLVETESPYTNRDAEIDNLLEEMRQKETLAGLELINRVINNSQIAARHLSKRKHNRPGFEFTCEYDTQDFIFAIIRAYFSDAKTEEFTPKHAGDSKRIDIVIPSIKTVIEIKYIRDENHAKKIANELKIDLESYHTHTSCKNLFIMIHDPDAHIQDPKQICDGLSGTRKKGDAEFEVEAFYVGK